MVMRVNISLERYKVFYYVAKYQNITRAAAALLSSQPNVTRAIRDLENALGCALFARSNRGVRLTPEGEALFSHVKIAVEQIELAESEIAGENALQNGAVSIFATDIALRVFLLPVLNEYRRRFPGVRLNIMNGSAATAISAVRNNLADIAVVTIPYENVRGLCTVPLKSVREIAVCGDCFEELAGREVSLKELAEYPLISLGAKTKTYEMFRRWFAENGAPFSPAVEAATADQILPMVKNNLGIGFVMEELVRDDPAGIRQILLKESPPDRTVTLLKRTDGVEGRAAARLEELMLAYREDV